MKNHLKRDIEISFISGLNQELEQAFYKILGNQKELSLNLYSLEDEPQKLPIHLVELIEIYQLIDKYPPKPYFDPDIKVVVGKNITLDQEADLIRLGFSDAIDLEQISLKGIKRVITNSYFRKMFEKKNAELKEKILHSSKLASLGLLTSGIAHELNNPLTALKGFTYRLSKQDLSSEKTQEITKKITFVANRMTRVVDGIRAYSKERNYEDTEEFSPFKILKEVLGFMEMILKPKGISVALESNINDDLKIWGNRSKFESIFQNIISNCRDAISEKMLTGGLIKINLEATEESLTIKIIDNGPGMTEETKSRIFDPFYTTKELGEGTGLGMGIVKEAVEIHRGVIEIQSRLEEGTTITLTFPLERGDRKKRTKCNRIESCPIGKVFVVDDDPLVTEAIKMALEKDYDVLTFNDAFEALQAIDTTVSLIITDLVMPGLDGFEFSLRLKSQHPKLPIWLITTNRTLKSLQEDSSAPFDNIIIKPIKDFSKLLNDIQKLFNN